MGVLTFAQEKSFLDMKDKIRQAGATVVDATDMPQPEEVFKFKDDKSAAYEIACQQRVRLQHGPDRR